ncbi:MAG TPA: hypothetical protein VMS98_02255 [Thermoanaerobaculia bacterium]|nr:hypothetical protein [Thermoanaerobaculia bacterium]
MILELLLVTVTFRPAAPTVGDPITLDFQEAVRLDASPSYEIVSQEGRRAVVRTFQPRPISLSGQAGNVRFRNLDIPVRSVIPPGDQLEPSALKKPLVVPAPRRPLMAIGIAGLACLMAWAIVLFLARAKEKVEALPPEMPAADRFRATVLSLIRNPRGQRWAALADATRRYLASLTPYLGADLTTSQLLPRIDREHSALVREILRRGDAEKFSPWGAPPGDFEAIATGALGLIPAPPQEMAA